MTAARAARAHPARPRPPWPGVAVAMAMLVVVLLAAGIFASTKTNQASGGSAIGGFALGLMFLIMAAVGLVVARFQRRNPIGYLLLGAALCFLLTLGCGGYAMLAYAQHGHLPLGAVALVLGQAGLLAVVMLPLIVLLFPDGRARPGAGARFWWSPSRSRVTPWRRTRSRSWSGSPIIGCGSAPTARR